MKNKMMVYAHYYHPDVASTGQILKELLEGMTNEFDITVITVVPSYTGKIEKKYKKKTFYEENINGIKVLRVKVPEFSKSNKVSRIINIISYFFGAMIATFKVGPQDFIFSISQPPILGGLLGVFGKVIKRGKFVYNIQDFNPEQTVAVGYSKNKTLLKFLMFLDKLSCQSSDLVIVVGRDMIETLKARFDYKKVPNHTFINNWTDEKAVYPLIDNQEGVLAFKKQYDLDDKFIIEYSGNIGLYYDLENLLKVIKKFKQYKDVVFVFIGDGSVKSILEKYKYNHDLDNVIFIPYQKKSDLIYSLNAGDVHWVVNAKGIKGVSVPSKLYGIMAAGKTVLGVLDEGSEARLIIEEAKNGFIATPNNYKEIEKLLQEVINNREVLKEIGINGRKYLEKYLTKDVAIAKYKNSILNVTNIISEKEKMNTN